MSCDHDLDAEYLHPSDARLVDIYEEGGTLRLRVVLPCPECSQPLELDAAVERAEETTLDVPLDDSADVYD